MNTAKNLGSGWVAQLLEHCPTHQKGTGSIPGLDMYRRDWWVLVSHLSLSLSFSLSSMKAYLQVKIKKKVLAVTTFVKASEKCREESPRSCHWTKDFKKCCKCCATRSWLHPKLERHLTCTNIWVCFLSTSVNLNKILKPTKF